MKNITKVLKLYAIATDPVYIGTGGYTIGRVDNTIVRDPVTKIPKIPGTSLAGTSRYFAALRLQSCFKEDYRIHIKKRNNVPLKDMFAEDAPGWVMGFDNNRYARIKCAGQDDNPNRPYENVTDDNSDHCGHCIVCKVFGFSKKNKSWQGMLFLSDMDIIFFPVYTRMGTRWVTSPMLLERAGIKAYDRTRETGEEKILTFTGNERYLNLGWLNLEVAGTHGIDEGDIPEKIKRYVKAGKMVIADDSLISQIINSNLEVRTSVSICPLTGTAKEGALFTSEAIPRGSVFYGEARIFDKPTVSENELLPEFDTIKEMIEDCGGFYETLGIGGMTNRGFGRIKLAVAEPVQR